MSGWVAPGFASLARPAPQAPLRIRMDSAGCVPLPAEPEQACEERLSAVTAAQLAIGLLQAGNLHAGTGVLRAALAAAERACDVYDEDRKNRHDTRRTHEQ